MSGLVRIEARHLARPALRWLGLGLAAVVAALRSGSGLPGMRRGRRQRVGEALAPGWGSTPGTLLGYRLRPLPWGEIAAAVTVVLALMVRGASGTPVEAVRLAVMACLFGLCGALLTAPEIDEGAEPVRCAPVGEWRTVAVRGLAWLAAGLGVLGALAVALQQTAAWSAAEVLRHTVGPFALVSVACAALASRTSVVAGAAGGCAIIGGGQLLALWFPGFPLQVLPLPGNPAAPTGWTAGCAAVLAAVTLLDRGRRGLPGIRRGGRADSVSRLARAAPR